MERHNQERGVHYQGMRASLKPDLYLTIIIVAISAAVITIFNHQTASVQYKRDKLKAEQQRNPAPVPPASPPPTRALPKQSELPAPRFTLRDAGPPSQLSETAPELETLFAWEQEEEPEPPLHIASPIGGMITENEGARGNGIGEGLTQDAPPSMFVTPEVHIDQSAPVEPAPVRKATPPKPPPTRHAGPSLFDFLWGAPPHHSNRNTRVMRWRSIGTAPPLPPWEYWPWQDEARSPNAPDTMPWAMTPGDETRCRMGNCY